MPAMFGSRIIESNGIGGGGDGDSVAASSS